jgi:hypothetical protein
MSLAPSRVLRVFRHALHFDGNDYVSIPNGIVHYTQRYFTCVAWVNTRVLDSREHIAVYSGAEGGEWQLTLDRENNFSFSVKLADGYWYRARTPGVRGVFVHLAGVRRGASLELWVNAELRGRVSIPDLNLFVLRGYHSSIGSYNRGQLHFWDGYISSVYVYTRDLTENEIKQTFAMPYNPPRNGLALWLYAHPNNIRDIDSDGILEWIDLSGHGNHGKIYGAQLVELVKAPVRVLARAR